jgi:hypothetical protein
MDLLGGRQHSHFDHSWAAQSGLSGEEQGGAAPNYWLLEPDLSPGAKRNS